MTVEEITKKIAEKAPSWVERLLMPKLSSIDGKLEAINTRIDSTNERIGSLRTEMDIKIESLRNEMKSEFKGLDYRFESIDVKLDRIPVIEEITALKLKIAELEKRMAMA
jgi:hypothetical protein